MRFAALILFVAFCAATGVLSKPQQGFPLTDMYSETPAFVQFLVSSALIFVFALAVQEAASSEDSMVFKSKAISLGTLTLACVAGAVELSKSFDLPGDLVFQGGLLTIGTAAVLSDSRFQQI